MLYYHLGISCILEETSLTNKLKEHGSKMKRNRKAAQVLQEKPDRTSVRDISVSLGQEDARIWAHKILT